MNQNNSKEGIDEKITKIDGANVSGGDIHCGLHNAINHVFFALTAEEYDVARNEVFAEVREIVKTLLHQELQKARVEMLHKLHLCAIGKYEGDALENVKAQIAEYQSELDQPNHQD